MVSASTTRATANILIGRTGGDPAYQRLIKGLEDQGYRVTERTSSPIGAHGSTQDLNQMLDGVDVAFIAVRDSDDLNAIGPVRPFQRVARDVGLLQGQLGVERVVLLVESAVDGLSSDLGVSVLRLPAGGPDQAIDQIVQRIGAIDPALVRSATVESESPQQQIGIGRRLSSIEEHGADTTWVPFALLGVIGLLALLGAILLAVSLVRSDDGEDQAAGDGRVELLDVTDSLRTGGSAPSGVGSIGVAGSSAPNEEGLVEGAGPDPAGPATGGDNQLLPASCEIDLSKSSLLDSATECDGAGVLVLDGSDGPWHNELVAVALSDGVVGELDYEGGGRQPLDAGVVALDRSEAAFGVESIRVSFSAAGQHVHLFADPDGSGREATLTLRLDR